MDGVNETVIAGGPDDYLEARHVVLRGATREIGRAIGRIARSVFDSKPLGHDEMHYALGVGLAFQRIQLDLAVDLSELRNTASVSAIFSF